MVYIMMTEQEIFDKVALHLLYQGQRSLNRDGVRPACAYRGDEGTKCAAGCLIPDEVYTPTIEGLTIKDLDADMLLECGIDDEGKSLDLIWDLQYLHDKSSPTNWRDRLYEVAATYKLSISVLEDFEI